MQSSNYFLASIIESASLFIGIFLALQVKEELKKGKSYFKMLGKVLFAAIFALTLNTLNIPITIRIVSYIGIIVVLSMTKLNNVLVFSALGAMFYFTSTKPEMFFLVSSLTFIFGLAAGGELAAEIKNKKFYEISKRGLKAGIAFAAITIILGSI